MNNFSIDRLQELSIMSLSSNVKYFSLFLIVLHFGCASKQVMDEGDMGLSSPQLASQSYLSMDVPTVEDVELDASAAGSTSPNDIADYSKIQYETLSLEQCIQSALESSEVIRDLGVSILRTPSAMQTELDPSLTFTDARFGEEAALSEFDANLGINASLQNNDRASNNRFSGNTNGLFKQDLHNYNIELSKVAATGTIFSLRHLLDFDANNQAGNRFANNGGSWQAILESEFRQPLLQGGGVQFNRIAGPSRQAGVYNGILIARTNTEISLSRFQQGVRDLVSNVENAYWDLFFAYKELDAQTAARDAARKLFADKKAKVKTDMSTSLEEASAKEQFYRFESNIINSLEGRVVDGTRVDNGIAGGSFRNSPGVRIAERRLRYLIGRSITDGVLIRPSDDEIPIDQAVVFDWNESISSATFNRPEIKQQKWVIKQKELELLAARNFLMPSLDLVGLYRFRGLGKSLTGQGIPFNADVNSGNPNSQTSDAFGDLSSGDFQEWQMGAELSIPIGFRRGHNAVQNAEISVSREKSVLREQQRAIVLGLSNAVAELKRSFVAMNLAYERLDAAESYRMAAKTLQEQGLANIDVLLEAERRVLDSTLQSLRAKVEYTLAIRNVHYEKGTLLEHNNVSLAENQSSAQAYEDAAFRNSAKRREINYVSQDLIIGAGEGVVTPDYVTPNAIPVPEAVDLSENAMQTGGEVQDKESVKMQLSDFSVEVETPLQILNPDDFKVPTAPFEIVDPSTFKIQSSSQK